MLNRPLYEIGNQMGMSKNQLIKGFEELQSKGLIFTPTKSAKDFFADTHPYRVAVIGPTASLEKSAISLGPFAISRTFYERHYLRLQELLNEDEFQVLIGFKKLEFEKFGATNEEERIAFSVRADEDALTEFFLMMPLWDLFHPLVYEFFVWILPNERCKELAEHSAGKTFSEDDHWWWNIVVDLGERFEPLTPSDMPERYSHIPNALIDDWLRFLPNWMRDLLWMLYSKATIGGYSKSSMTEKEIYQVIQESIAAFRRRNLLDISENLVDWELLMKELCDFNSLPYPTDHDSTFDYLLATGFLLPAHNNEAKEYILALEIPSPQSVLKLPENWQDRVDKFIETGSILFAYLSVEEILS